ncbi:hypothetical protein ABTF50_20385, partial [Acinetobacter baumannii]
MAGWAHGDGAASGIEGDPVFHSPYSRIEIPSVSVYDHLFGSLEDADLDRVAIIDPQTGAETTY